MTTQTQKPTALQFLAGLRPALPMSAEKPCIPMSNGELRRQIMQGAALINTERITPDELIDFPVFSVVFFPKSPTRRCTLV
jgi:hypothetical protein